MEEWLKRANERISAEALHVYADLRKIAVGMDIEFEYVLKVFIHEFKKIAKLKCDD